VCPVGAITVVDRKSYIDQSKCIKCGKCKSICPYDAIAKKTRPCQKACGVNAIKSDKRGRAYIDNDKCVSCGQCMVSCPFGAISDKSQVFQLCRALKEGQEVIAEIAPAFVGQFGENITPHNIKAALKELGFSKVYETALGADIGAVAEAHHYVEKVVTGELPFLLTSCCPAWSVLAKKYFPDLADKVSQELTPMVATGRTIKREHPNAKVVFIGPCASKKLEASRRSVRSDVDFVITFEELQGMFDAKGIDLTQYKSERSLHDATGAGRGYAVAGGVANAIERCIKEYYPGTEVKIEHAEGLTDCKKALLLAKAGKKNGYLIEGMGCSGGCIAGAGTNIPIATAQKCLAEYVKNSSKDLPAKELEEIVLD
jgi:[FeFe] hydrogenase (group B1/B3)